MRCEQIITSPADRTDFAVAFAILLLVVGFTASCGHPKQVQVSVPPPPTAGPERSAAPSAGESSSTNSGSHYDPAEAEPSLRDDARPLATETGLASWYGPPYHNRRGSNGEVYNMHAMTAAHRTFPLGSIVRVTNLKTGHSALVRITDRGPFISGRILDLSLAAARKVDVWQPGVAQVRVDLLEAPSPVDIGGKWAVQIGGFSDEPVATRLADHLTRRYHTAKVLCFASPAGDWWIRVRVLDDDRKRAQQVAAETATTEGAVFVVRLD